VTLRRVTRIPLTLTSGAPVLPMSGRQADTPPFRGGSYYRDFRTGAPCSNGYAIRGEGLLPPLELSAGHCAAADDPISIPDQEAPAGTVLDKATCRDILEINYGGTPAKPSVQGRVYTGGPTSTTSLPVAAAAPDFVGDLVDTSGATSGEHVNARVSAIDVFVKETGVNCTTVGPLTEAVLAGKCVVAPGDSGGPVFAATTTKSVVARGTISGAGGAAGKCPSDSGTVEGHDTVYYAPLLRPAGDPQVGSLQYELATIITG
jgi:hypothetical protein